MSEVPKVIREEDVSFVHNKDEAWTVGYVAEQRKDRIAVRAAASLQLQGQVQPKDWATDCYWTS